MGFSGAHALSMNLRLILSGRGIFFLSNMADPRTLLMWQQGRIYGQRLGLSAKHTAEWSNYMAVLINSHIRLSFWEDFMVWVHHSSEEYLPKNGYIQLNLEVQN